MIQFYIDTCIWLNLFKKEGDSNKGKPYWKIAKEFLEKIMFTENEEAVYSGFVLKELKSKLDDKTFQEKLIFLKEEPKFKFIKATNEDYILARKIEAESKYDLSFFDCAHISICKRNKLILITRDNKLLNFAGQLILAKRPEDLPA